MSGRNFKRLPSPALVVAMIALTLAMSGAAVALEGRGRVKANDIAKAAVRSRQIKDKSVKGRDIRDGTITSKQVRTEGLDSSDLAEYEVADDAPTRIVATEGANAALARAAAPEVVLYRERELTVYAKCFRDAAAGETIGEVLVRTDAGPALLDGLDQLPNDDGNLLHPSTPEPQRRLHSEQVAAPNSADYGTAIGAVAGPDGTAFETRTTIAVKQGSLGQGNGAFGDGAACLFSLTVTG